MVIRRHFALDAELDALARLADDERMSATEAPLLQLSSEDERELEEFQSLTLQEAQDRRRGLSSEVLMQLTYLGIREQADELIVRIGKHAG